MIGLVVRLRIVEAVDRASAAIARALEDFARAYETPESKAVRERLRQEIETFTRSAKEREQRSRERSVPRPALARALFVPQRTPIPLPRRAPWPVALRAYS